MNILNITTFEDIAIESAFGIAVVFAALILLAIAFGIFGNLIKRSSRKKTKIANADAPDEIQEKELTGDEIAAISMALHLYIVDVHDEESNVITIKRIERRYSPWNSKIYGLTNLNR